MICTAYNSSSKSRDYSSIWLRCLVTHDELDGTMFGDNYTIDRLLYRADFQKQHTSD